MADRQAALVWCPFPDRDTAKKIASELLDRKLIACANLFGNVESLFSWEGEIQSDVECGALFKTDTSKMPSVITQIGELHPYKTPAILGWNCDSAYPATLDWIEEILKDD
ncbi:divalent-cation tolerance protein CutA [Erythrobacter sp. YT30]|uniref:divalent-cation tolerance protein CutA n=1 Tax=Erythrobacter sp. YT30 TaxID=1735012 RepID=UPI00076D59A4|nr:divalent-cation tolerance protein CutA [Erythrobacter sp. YT30]KWV91438.1 divalent cation transporter [Erythrobacter sp. YT30]